MVEITKVQIIETVAEHTYVVGCSYCKGRGLAVLSMHKWEISSYQAQDSCPVCRGKGVLKIKSDDILVQDSRCCGTGHQPASNFTTSPDQICDTCDGLGAQSLSGKCKLL